MANLLRKTLRYTYFPFVVLVGNAASIYIIANTDARYSWLLSLMLVFIMISMFAEKILPYDVEFNRARGDKLRDVLHASVNEIILIVGILSVPLFSQAFAVVHIWPEHWALWQQLILAIVLADMGITLAHMASHKLPTLWKMHAPHHSMKRLYGFNGLMRHPAHQIIETIAGVSPLILIGVTQEAMMMLTTAVVFQLLLQHSNVNYAMGPLKYILSANVTHRLHHLSDPVKGNVNFGLFTFIIDHIMGTFRYTPERISVKDIGLNDYPVTYVAQIVEPFRSEEKRARPVVTPTVVESVVESRV